MNYQDIYDSIIFRAIDLHGHPLTPRKQVHGFAVHHILPASWWQGGRKNPDANVPENLCWLTHREHFTAHWLLARMYGGAMSQAFVLMCRDTGKTNGRAYETHLLKGIAWRKGDKKIRQTLKAAAQKRATDPLWLDANKARMQILHADPDFYTRRVEALRKVTSTPEWLAMHREGCKKRSESPEWQEQHRQMIVRRSQNPEWVANTRRALVETKKNPDWKRKQQEGAKRHAENNPEWVEAAKIRNQAMQKDPAYQERWKEKMETVWSDPNWQSMHREKLARIHADPEIQEKRLNNVRAVTQTAEWKEKQLANSRKQRKPVIGTNSETGEEIYLLGGSTIKDAGFNRVSILRCCKGQQPAHKGHTWRYATDEDRH